MPQRDVIAADPSATPTLGDRRTRVLSMLQAASGPIGVADVAEALGLHPNTARFHLDALVQQGLADRASEDRMVPGRPRTLYTASLDGARAGSRSYRLLVEILTGYLAGQPTQAALQAGEAWGRAQTAGQARTRRIDAAAATDQLVAALGDIGFAPEAVTKGRQRQILLHHCPFREAAESHPEVVCSVHLGLMRGMLAELDAPLDVERLDPFVRPNVCVTHLGARGRDGTSGRRAG